MKEKIKQILDIERYRNKDGYVEDIILLPDELHKILDYITRQNKEIERLNNIINELEEELDRGYRDLFEHELVPGRELITNIKNYLQELKGSDKE